MAERLFDFARYFISHVERRKELDVPVLLWDEPSGSASRGQTLDLTPSGPAGGFLRGGEPMVFPLRKGPSVHNAFVMGVTVGRTENNDLVLDHSSISRFHAYFLRDSRTKTWKLVDAESKNFTWVGPLRMERGGTAPLQDRVHLRFGDIEMTYLEPASFFRHVERMINAR